MTATLTIPDEIPAMILPGTVLLPQTALPLRIFEPRYREMLSDALAGNRMFAIANQKPSSLDGLGDLLELHDVAAVGIIRMSAQNRDGTSLLLLLGAIRARIRGLISLTPYPVLKIEPMPSRNVPEGEARDDCVNRLLARVDCIHELIAPNSSNTQNACNKIQNAEPLLHFIMQNYCNDAVVKQQILETTDFPSRERLAEQYLDHQISTLKLKREIMGGWDDPDSFSL